MPPDQCTPHPGEAQRGSGYLIYSIIRASFLRAARYRVSTLSSIIVNSLFGIVRASLLITAIQAAGGELHGYDTLTAVTFAWLTQALIGPFHAFSWTTLSHRIYTGDIATDLARPISPLAWYWGEFIGTSALQVLTRSVPILFVGALFTGLSLTPNPAVYALGILTLTLGVTVQYLLFFMVNCLAFFTVQIRGVMQTYLVISQTFAGFMVPLKWFPEWFQQVAYQTPFAYTFQFNIDVFQGRLSLPEIFSGIGIQLLWIALTGAGAMLCLQATRRRVEIQGG